MQYSEGTVAVTNGSAAIVGTGTTWSTDGVAAGMLFTIEASGVSYQIASVTDDTHATLAANYGGSTASGQSYAINAGFTTNRKLPYWEKGDVETATLIKAAFLTLDNLLGATYTANRVIYTDASGNLTTGSGITYSAGALAVSASVRVAGAFATDVASTGGIEIDSGFVVVRGWGADSSTVAKWKVRLSASNGSGTVYPIQADGSGNVYFGGSSGVTPDATHAGVMVGVSNQVYSSCGSSTGAETHHRFINGNGLVGSISTNGSATAFNTSSDERAKPRRDPITDSGAVIDALQPIYHNWAWDLSANVPGFSAQAVYSVVPTAATPGDSDSNKRPGDDGYIGWMREDSKLVPYIVAELKALRARVATLEAQVTELQGG